MLGGGFAGFAIKGLQFYGSILGAAYERATTSEIWQVMRDAAYSTAESIVGRSSVPGLPSQVIEDKAAELLSGIGIQDVNAMRAMASQNIAAEAALAGAPPEFAITSDMIGRAPNAITGGSSGVPEQYVARYEFTGVDEAGAELTDWSSLLVDVPLTTVGDLNDWVQAEAQAQVDAGTGTPTVVTLSSINRIVLGVL